MQTQVQFWVLNRLCISVQKYPVWGDKIEIHTWVNHMKGPFSYRHFEIYDEQKKIISTASTLWVLLDANTRKQVRLSEHTLVIIDKATPACGQAQKLTPLQKQELLSVILKYNQVTLI